MDGRIKEDQKKGDLPLERVILIGLDGLPYSLLKRMTKKGLLPNFSSMKKKGSIKETHSVLPTVSGVAWASIATGMEPCGHGIFGFVELRRDSLDLHIPTRADKKAPAIWETLSERGRRVCSIGVPMTFPPPELNGLVVSGFLAPNLAKGVAPKKYLPTLEKLGYRIDVDPKLAHQDLDAFVEDLHAVFDARVKSMLHFMDSERWDLFVTHFIDTDRINHFLWGHMVKNEGKYAREFFSFYGRVDRMLGEVSERLAQDQCLILCSDHGFCTLKSEVYINHWLQKKGLLKFTSQKPNSFKNLHRDSSCYCLDPGRIYFMDRHRKKSERGGPMKIKKRDLAKDLASITEPKSGSKVVEKVFLREEAYHGPCMKNGPGIILAPKRGFELRGTLNKDTLYGKGPVSGVHSYDDAFLFITGKKILTENPSITDIAPTIYKIMGEELPEGMDGRPVI